MTGTLFLGGPRHGELHPIPRHLHAVQVPTPEASVARRDFPLESPIRVVMYVEHSIVFHLVARSVRVFVLATWDEFEVDEAIAKWIETGE